MATNVLPDEFRCSYPFKFCNERRALKKCGEPHKLCQFHRERANMHQQELARRRRQMREQLGPQPASSATTGRLAAGMQLSFSDISDLLDEAAFLKIDCSEEDLRAVEILLSDSDNE